MYVRSMSNWTEWDTMDDEAYADVPLCPQGPATNTFTHLLTGMRQTYYLFLGARLNTKQLLKVKQWFSEVIASLFRFFCLTISLKLAV